MIGSLQLCQLFGELPRLRLPRFQLGAQFGLGVGAGKVLGGAEEEGGALVVVGETGQLRLQLKNLLGLGGKFDSTFHLAEYFVLISLFCPKSVKVFSVEILY